MVSGLSVRTMRHAVQSPVGQLLDGNSGFYGTINNFLQDQNQALRMR